jgi:hypothetical protein
MRTFPVPLPATQLLQAALSLGMSRRVSRAARCETRLCYGASRLQQRGPRRLETVDWNSIAGNGRVSGCWTDLERGGGFELGWSAWLCVVGWLSRSGQPRGCVIEGGGCG